MTNGELIEHLRTLDKDAEAIVAVRTFTQAFTLAHVSPFTVQGNVIYISLPENQYIASRKKAL